MTARSISQHTYSDLWDAVLQERLRQAVTIDALAALTGIPAYTVARYLRGDTSVPYGRVVLLAEALGIVVTAVVTRRYVDMDAAA